MFYEDFSNPKYISDKCNWTFPHVQNFYLNNSQVFYESRKIKLENPILGKDEIDLLLVIPASTENLTSNNLRTSKVSVHLEGKEEWQIADVFRISPMFINKCGFDYYRMRGQVAITEEPLINYKVKINNLSLNSIKIYGL